MPSPSSIVMVPPATPAGTKWTIEMVTRALDAHEAGDFTMSAQLARALHRDDRIEPCARDRINALVGAGAAQFTLEPVTGAFSSRSKPLAARVSEWHPTVFTAGWMMECLWDVIFLGFSISYVVWDISTTEWRPKQLIKWDADFVQWSDADDCYLVSTLGGQVKVRANDPNWLVVGMGARKPHMFGAILALGCPYVFRQLDWRDWSRYNERHGLPIIKITEPANEITPGEKEAFFRGMQRMSRNGIIRLPQGDNPESPGYDVDIMEAKARSYDSFNQFLDAVNTGIAIYLKGGNLSTEVQGGSFAAAGWHMRVRKDYAENDAQAMAAGITWLLKLWGYYSVTSWDDRMCPVPTWDLSIPEDAAQTAKVRFDNAQTVEKLLQNKVPVDWDEFMPMLGIPLKKGAKMPEPEDTPEPPTDGAPVVPPKGGGKKLALRPGHFLASGASAQDNAGFISGQLFADGLVDTNAPHADAALQPTVDAILEELDAADSHENFRERLHARYATLDASEISELVYRVWVEGELAGRAAVNQDAV
jgi:phage gp29-like protein